MDSFAYLAKTDYEKDTFSGVEIFAYVAGVGVGLAGIFLNALFIKNTFEFVRKKTKCADIQLLAIALACFNILYLISIVIDVSIRAHFQLNSIFVLERYPNPPCDWFVFFQSYFLFGMAYFLTSLARDSFVAADDTRVANEPNRFQMCFETVLIWSVEGLVFLLIGYFGYDGFHYSNQVCLPREGVIIYREVVLLLLLSVSLIYLCGMEVRLRSMPEQSTSTRHVLLQCKKTMITYMICWFPTLLVRLILRLIEIPDPVNVIALFLFILASVAFPLVWQVKSRENVYNQEKI